MTYKTIAQLLTYVEADFLQRWCHLLWNLKWFRRLTMILFSVLNLLMTDSCPALLEVSAAYWCQLQQQLIFVYNRSLKPTKIETEINEASHIHIKINNTIIKVSLVSFYKKLLWLPILNVLFWVEWVIQKTIVSNMVLPVYIDKTIGGYL